MKNKILKNVEFSQEKIPAFETIGRFSRGTAGSREPPHETSAGASIEPLRIFSIGRHCSQPAILYELTAQSENEQRVNVI